MPCPTWKAIAAGIAGGDKYFVHVLLGLFVLGNDIPGTGAQAARRHFHGAVAAAEAAVALAIALNFYNNYQTIDIDRGDKLQG